MLNPPPFTNPFKTAPGRLSKPVFDLFLQFVRNRDEKTDIVLLLTGALTTLTIWMVFLAWSPLRTIPGHDALDIGLPHLLENVKAHGEWQGLLYRVQVLGGAIIHDVVGSWIVLEWGIKLGLSTTSVMNILVFVLQLFVSFMSVHAVFDLLICWEAPQGTAKTTLGKVFMSVPLFVLTGFAPFLAYKLSYGHSIFIIGSLPFIASCSLFLAACAGRVSLTLLTVALTSTAKCLSSGGQQALAYSMVFGAPILAGLVLSVNSRNESGSAADTRLKGLLFAALVLFAGLLIMMPRFAGMLAYAFGGEGGRSLGGQPVVYSFLPSAMTIKDWIGSATWSFRTIYFGRTEFFHETDYAIGPLMLLVFLAPWKKARPLIVGLFASLAMAVLFSLNVTPFSTFLLKVCPILNSFRVPQRSVIPFMFLMTVAASAAVLYGFSSKRDGPRRVLDHAGTLTCVVAALATFRLSPSGRELLAWLLAAALMVLRFTGLKVRPKGVVVLLVLAMLGVSAFKERLLPYSDVAGMEEKARLSGNTIREKEPALNEPLARAVTHDKKGLIGLNYLWLSGISSVDNYWFPTYRFLMLHQTLKNENYYPLEVHLSESPQSPEFEVLRQLYNVIAVFYGNTTSGYRWPYHPGKTAGPAWFAQKIATAGTWRSLAEKLKKHGAGLHEAVKAEMLVLDEDVKLLGPAVDESPRAGCGSAGVMGASALPYGQDAVVEVRDVIGTCPLAVAMNYSSIFNATGIVDGREIPLKTFPAYGSLMGVMVPQGAGKVTLKAVSYTPWWTWVARIAGILTAVSLAALVLLSRKRNFNA